MPSPPSSLSSPAPPASTSLPAPPTTMSSPAPALSVSLNDVPWTWMLPDSDEVSTTAPEPVTVTRSSVRFSNAAKPSATPEIMTPSTDTSMPESPPTPGSPTRMPVEVPSIVPLRITRGPS